MDGADLLTPENGARDEIDLPEADLGEASHVGEGRGVAFEGEPREMLMGEILIGADHTHRLAPGGAGDEAAAGHDPAPGPVAVAHAVQALVERGLAVEVPFQCGLGEGQVVGVAAGRPFFDAGRQGGGVLAQHGGPARVEVGAAAGHVPVPQAEFAGGEGQFGAVRGLPEFILGGLAGGDVALHRHEPVQNAGFVAQGDDIQVDPVFGPVFFAVEDLAFARFAAAEGGAHRGDDGGVGAFVLQDFAGGAAEDLGGLVAGHAGEALVDPGDVASGVGENHGVGGAGGDEGEEADVVDQRGKVGGGGGGVLLGPERAAAEAKDQEGEGQTEADAAKGRRVDVEARFGAKVAGGAGDQPPVHVAQRQAGALFEGGRAVVFERSVGVPEERTGGGGGVVLVDVEFEFGFADFAGDVRKQAFGEEGKDDPAQEAGAARLRRGGRGAGGVNRMQEQETGPRDGGLHEGDVSGGGGLAGEKGVFGGGAAHGVLGEVEAEGGAVGFGGFDELHDVQFGGVAEGLDLEFRGLIGAGGGHEVLERGAGDAAHKTDP